MLDTVGFRVNDIIASLPRRIKKCGLVVLTTSRQTRRNWPVTALEVQFCPQSGPLNFHRNMAQDPKTTSSLPREGGSTLLRRSCHDCNRRKVRCNKSLPCDNCERLGFECSYPPPGRKPRKIIKKASNKTELVSRLGFLEDQIKKLGGKVFEEDSPDAPPAQNNDVDVQESRAVRSWLDKQSPRGGVSDQPGEVNENELEISKESVSPKASSSTLENQFGRLVVDRNSGTSRYVNHRVLTELADQVYLTSLWYCRAHRIDAEAVVED